MRSLLLAVLLGATLTSCTGARPETQWEAPAIPEPLTLNGQNENGAQWAADVPSDWNGVLLLFARGYSPNVPTKVSTAPPNIKSELLERGYALAASSYSSGGWALADSPNDQILALDAFIAEVGQPKQIIAWGTSMGGLTTLAISEKYADRIDGALALCGSVSGAVPMLNTALDGAFAFKTLVAPTSQIQLVNIDDDRENSRRVREALEVALKNPEGRARIALAGVLAQIPGWTDPSDPKPTVDDYDGQFEQIAKAFVMGVFLPRADQEQRAGGVTSWNTGVDYREQLRLSGKYEFVHVLYQQAGLNLDADLDELANAKRIVADRNAVDYMHEAYTPNGQPGVPVLTVHELGDGMTIPNLEVAYRNRVRAQGKADLLAQAWLNKAGHCRFSPQEQLAAIKVIERRIQSGEWDSGADQLNALASKLGDAPVSSFVNAAPTPLLRACDAGTGSCPGAPTPFR